jgi:hypothetical protein
MTHGLTCACEARCTARTAAWLILQKKLLQLHTSDILTKLICESTDLWMSRRPLTFPVWHGAATIQREICRAFTAQSKIGWDQFLHGRIAKVWQKPIQTYYQFQQPVESFTLEQWMQKLISAALWTSSLTMWWQWCIKF